MKELKNKINKLIKRSLVVDIPFTLANVLEAVNYSNKGKDIEISLQVYEDGEMHVFYDDEVGEHVVWDLKEPLDNQNEEVIEFLNNIINNN